MTKRKHSAWDDLACKDALTALLDTPSPWNHCRLLTAQKSHTAARSEAFPIVSIGNLLSPDERRITIALWTGGNIFESTECRCGKFVDRLGIHGFSCIKNVGRYPRHSAINSILKWSLTRIGLPSVLEPVGLTKDRRRPDGLTLNPWYRGKSFVWDATVVDTFAESHYIVSAAIPGSVATDADTDKCGNTMTLTIITFNQLQSKPLVCMASPLLPSWAVSQKICWHFRRPQRGTVASPAPVSGRGQREHR